MNTQGYGIYHTMREFTISKGLKHSRMRMFVCNVCNLRCYICPYIHTTYVHPWSFRVSVSCKLLNIFVNHATNPSDSFPRRSIRFNPTLLPHINHNNNNIIIIISCSSSVLLITMLLLLLKTSHSSS